MPHPATNGEIKRLETQLKANIFGKAKPGQSEERTLQLAFKSFDMDNSGEVNFFEFVRAMGRNKQRDLKFSPTASISLGARFSNRISHRLRHDCL